MSRSAAPRGAAALLTLASLGLLAGLAGCSDETSSGETSPTPPTSTVSPSSRQTGAPTLVRTVTQELAGTSACAVLPKPGSTSVWVVGCDRGLWEVAVDGTVVEHATLGGRLFGGEAVSVGGATANVPIDSGTTADDPQSFLVALDLTSGEVTERIALGPRVATSSAVLGDTVHVSFAEGAVVTFTVGADHAEPSVGVVGSLVALEADPDRGWLWLIGGDGRVRLWNPTTSNLRAGLSNGTMRVRQTVRVEDALWLLDSAGALTRVSNDDRTGLDVPGVTVALVACGDRVWLSQSRLGATTGQAGLRAVDAAGTTVAMAETPAAISALTCVDGLLWGMVGDGALVRINPTEVPAA